jgi:thiosulfate reductase cytochrome b subunit
MLFSAIVEFLKSLVRATGVALIRNQLERTLGVWYWVLWVFAIASAIVIGKIWSG